MSRYQYFRTYEYDSDPDSGVIEISFENRGTVIDLYDKREEIAKKLGLWELDEDVGSILAKSINAAVKAIKKQMESDVKKQYAITNEKILKDAKEGGLRKKTVKNGENPVIAITSKGPMRDLTDFTISPSNVQDEPTAVSAMVKRGTGLRPLKRRGAFAFAVRFRSGHVAVAQRYIGEKYLTTAGRKYREAEERGYQERTGIKFPWDMTRIKKLRAPALPHLFGNEIVLSDAGKMLQEIMNKEVEKRIAQKLNQTT